MPTQRDFERLAEMYELPKEVIKLFGKLFDRDRHMAKSVLAHLNEMAGEKPSNGVPLRRTKSFHRVANILVRADNVPKTKMELIEMSGVPEGTVHSLIYNHNRNDFEPVSLPNSRAKGYRLTKAVFEELKGGG